MADSKVIDRKETVVKNASYSGRKDGEDSQATSRAICMKSARNSRFRSLFHRELHPFDIRFIIKSWICWRQLATLRLEHQNLEAGNLKFAGDRAVTAVSGREALCMSLPDKDFRVRHPCSGVT